MAITYATPTVLSGTSVNSLASGNYAGIELFDNTTAGYHDVIFAGYIKEGATVSNNEPVYIFLSAIVPDNAGTGVYVQGSVNGGYTGVNGALVEATGSSQEIKKENLYGARSVLVDGTGNAVHEFTFSTIHVLGYVPPKIGLVVYNGTLNTLASSGHAFEATGLFVS